MPEQKYTSDGVAVISNATMESTIEILAREAKKDSFEEDGFLK